ncbi:hypothetical protein SteCoe_12309 [Stentor coeruleus]|uniref:Uncharacterized protein n=1 Tax=Stentor coeruleus TaxID=5963 RepID=A0A1R2CB53_9CILI|nr:hypothetical protein SteCoe_12309 [Stentor coeruleus]
MMDSDLLEWLSYEELQELETDNLIGELQSKLRKTEKFNIEQIMMNQVKSQELIEEINKADLQLDQLQSFTQSTIDKIQELRQRAGPLESDNSQYIIEQRNLVSLSNYLISLSKNLKK